MAQSNSTTSQTFDEQKMDKSATNSLTAHTEQEKVSTTAGNGESSTNFKEVLSEWRGKETKSKSNAERSSTEANPLTKNQIRNKNGMIVASN